MDTSKHKLYDYEATPPAGAWNRIAERLDDDASMYDVGPRLHSLEATPPPAAWDRIHASLNQEDQAFIQNSAQPAVQQPEPAIAKAKAIRFPSFVKYAVAALLVGAVAISIWFTSGNTGSGSAPVAGVNINQKDAGDPGASSSVNSGTTAHNPADNLVTAGKGDAFQSGIVAAAGVVGSLASMHVDAIAIPHAPSVKYASGTRRSSTANRSGIEPENALYAYEDHIPSTADRYILLMTPEGNFIRMSKKLSGLVCCVSGEEQDADCRDQIRKWQQEIANSPVSPAPGNVMEILDLVNALNNGTQL